MTVRTDLEEGVGRLILADPPLNILSRETMRQLTAALEELERAPEVRVLVLEGEGPNFSAGASVEEHLPDQVEVMIPEFTDTMIRFLDTRVPLIAAVQGRCLGGGFELALAADLMIVAEGASLGVPEIRLGVFPPAACALLPERTSRGVTAHLLFTGEALSGTEAVHTGIAHRAVPNGAVQEEACQVAREMARWSAPALRAAKSAWTGASRTRLVERLRHAQEIYLRDLMAAEDPEEGLRAFLEKRSPQWRHR